MQSSYPPHHIKSVTVNSSGWVVPTTRIEGTHHRNGNDNDIAITECCRVLLKELGLTLSHDMFRNTSVDGGGNNHGESDYNSYASSCTCSSSISETFDEIQNITPLSSVQTITQPTIQASYRIYPINRVYPITSSE
eukprot:scaffold6579_cov55-Cyclotella_meneghiniana.AAC.1